MIAFYLPQVNKKSNDDDELHDYTENKNGTTPNPKGFVGLKDGFVLSTEPRRVSISFQFSEPFQVSQIKQEALEKVF